jgi:hypothetical protein
LTPGITDVTQFRRSSCGVSAAVGGETVILDQRSGSYFSVSDVGEFIWNELQTPRSLDDLVRAVMAEYDIDTQRCRQDLIRFLDSMLAQGLMETRDIDGS